MGSEMCIRDRAEEAEPYMGGNMQAAMANLEKRMFEAAENLEFEEAARLRDEMHRLKAQAASSES